MSVSQVEIESWLWEATNILRGPVIPANPRLQEKIWDTDSVVEVLLKEYPHLDPEVQDLIPLRTIWTLADPDA